ncbi:MAG: hypothetical protein A3F70_00190 [Acidobacteria bacterium RIFCSPLOWO2_12_FULL_67_14]|nr:MAG: hypothetical protein A3H29_17255 [Acidobacteria bacterium RIFCSPLOWO2_02_FULL_67_21]OFW41357.1 MAG: hypothetical protein A3F70_00190 [Acidobacteria bacterium RIFCSPLOWO2_12_FULL_67_14]
MSSSATLVETVLVGRESGRRAVKVAAVSFIAALTAAAAQISIPLPFTAVPFTFQPMVVLLGGLALGPKLGAASQLLYLVAGCAGLPVFAASAALPQGILRLLGPTGGYLMAYPFAAYVVGYLAERGFDRRYLTSVLAMLAGLVIVYACGAVWLGYFAARIVPGVPAGLEAALTAGVYPFVIADVMKLLVAAGVLPGTWAILGRQRT